VVNAVFERLRRLLVAHQAVLQRARLSPAVRRLDVVAAVAGGAVEPHVLVRSPGELLDRVLVATGAVGRRQLQRVLIALAEVEAVQARVAHQAVVERVDALDAFLGLGHGVVAHQAGLARILVLGPGG